MTDVRAEIDSMLDGIVTPEEPVTEEVAEETADESTDLSDDGVEKETDEEVEEGTADESEEEVSSVEEEEVSEEKTEVTEEVEEVVEEETVEVEVVDEAAGLRDQINQMAMLLQEKGIPMPGLEASIADSEAAVAAPAPVVPQTTMTLADLVIMEEGADFDSIMDKPEAFVEFQRGLLQRYSGLVEQQIGRALPAIVASQVKTITALNKAVDTFYGENEDLMAVRPTVGAIADRIVAVHPDWTLEQVMAEAATTTRKVLKMPEIEKGKPTGGKKVVRPSFVKQKGTKKAPQLKISGLQKDIDDIIN